MIYAQFYQNSIDYDGKHPVHKIEACGDRSVCIIDGRLSSKTIGKIAAIECQKRGFIAWRIFKCDSFSRSKPISGLWPINDASTEDKSASSATWGN